jgi:hypothetical protein
VRIDSVFGIGDPDPTSVEVSGTATHCKNVEVTVSCNTEASSQAVVSVTAGGKWNLTLDAADLRCRCGRRVSVVARCTEHRECLDRFETEKLRCRPSMGHRVP